MSEILLSAAEIGEHWMDRFIGVDLGNSSDIGIKIIITFTQVKHHKKKRINKKWLKRYGVVVKDIRTLEV